MTPTIHTLVGGTSVTKLFVSFLITRHASNMLSAFRLPGFTIQLEFVFNSSMPSSDESKDIELAEDGDVELEMTCEEIDKNDCEIVAAVQSAFFTSKIQSQFATLNELHKHTD